MKLNSKGYMLVEIIIAAVIAFSIAYYLLNLTYKFKNKNEDVYNSVTLYSEKINITKNIMNDLEGKTISGITSGENFINFTLTYSDNSTELRKLMIDKDTSTIKYGKLTETGFFETKNISYYEKKLAATTEIGDITIKQINPTDIAEGVSVQIPIKSIYSDKDYTIRLMLAN